VRSPDELTVAFRERGLKVTPQRQCIFRILHENPMHPAAETVYAQAVAQMPTISLRTVYQTLNDLADMGELQVLSLGTGSARFDPNVERHHHLVCDRCGKVRDVYVDASSLRAPRGAKAHGFAVTSTEVVFRGVCDSCSTSSSTTHERTSHG
jgi:Fe2+ or Zn2+ uptake regulation protein